MRSRKLGIIGLGVLAAALLYLVRTSNGLDAGSVSDSEAATVWGGQYCSNFKTVDGCGSDTCDTATSYNPSKTGTRSASGTTPVQCDSANPDCGQKDQMDGPCAEPLPPLPTDPIGD